MIINFKHLNDIFEKCESPMDLKEFEKMIKIMLDNEVIEERTWKIFSFKVNAKLQGC